MASRALAEYYLEKAYRKAASMPASAQAQPDLGAITLKGVSEMATAEQEAQSAGQRLELAQAKLAERARQAQETTGFKQEELRAARKGNVWATGIGLANLALTGLGGAAGIKEAEKEEAFRTKMLAGREEMKAIQERQLEDLKGMMPPFLGNLQQSGTGSWFKKLKPVVSGSLMGT